MKTEQQIREKIEELKKEIETLYTDPQYVLERVLESEEDLNSNKDKLWKKK